MIRTQIQLTEEQARALKVLSAREGVSMAELIRQAVERVIARDNQAEKWRPASALVGRYSGGPTDVSTRHDEYLADDFKA